MIVKIADFGQFFRTCFSSSILEIQDFFLRKIVIGKNFKFKVFPVFARKYCVCLSGRFPARLSKLLSICPEEMIWETIFLGKRLCCTLSSASSKNISVFGKTPAGFSKLHDTFSVKRLKKSENLGRKTLRPIIAFEFWAWIRS